MIFVTLLMESGTGLLPIKLTTIDSRPILIDIKSLDIFHIMDEHDNFKIIRIPPIDTFIKFVDNEFVLENVPKDYIEHVYKPYVWASCGRT